MRTIARCAFITLLPFIAASEGNAQSAPHLSGRVAIDPSSGTLAGSVCLSEVPVRGDTVTIVLGRSLTIRRLAGVAPAPVAVELEPGGAAVRYTHIGARSLVRPRTTGSVTRLCLEYQGSEPVYRIDEGDYRFDDGSSVIAFNGRTMRARGVSRWYPTSYDPSSGVTSEAASFDLEIECVTCETIYINGAEPASGPLASFSSSEPRELFLLAGHLEWGRTNGMTVVGESIPAHHAAVLRETIDEISVVLATWIGLPFGPPPSVVRIEPIREPRAGQLWGFFSDPALVVGGMSLQEVVRALTGEAERPRRAVYGFLAHELAHRYFGWTIGSGSPQRDLFGEPFATYLELKVVRQVFGYEEYRRSVSQLRERVLRASEPIRIDRASADDLADDTYRYAYAPLMLLSLEDAIGEEAMRALLRELLESSHEERILGDYEWLRGKALEIGVPDGQVRQWESRCLARSIRRTPCLEEVTRRAAE